MGDSEKRSRRFFVAGGKSVCLFKAAEEAFGLTAVGIQIFIIRPLVEPVLFG